MGREFQILDNKTSHLHTSFFKLFNNNKITKSSNFLDGNLSKNGQNIEEHS